MNYDITPIINAVIALLGIIITVILIPYIKSKTTAAQQAIIAATVQTAVYGFEQIVTGTGMGAEKFDMAMTEIKRKLADKNITFNVEDIRLQIEAAVKSLNIEQGK